MLSPWILMSLCFVFLSYALWRWTQATRDMLGSRRNEQLMDHLDWTRKPVPARISSRKQGLFGGFFGR